MSGISTALVWRKFHCILLWPTVCQLHMFHKFLQCSLVTCFSITNRQWVKSPWCFEVFYSSLIAQFHTLDSLCVTSHIFWKMALWHIMLSPTGSKYAQFSGWLSYHIVFYHLQFVSSEHISRMQLCHILSCHQFVSDSTFIFLWNTVSSAPTTNSLWVTMTFF